MAHFLFFAFVVTVAVLLATFQAASARSQDPLQHLPLETRCSQFTAFFDKGDDRGLRQALDDNAFLKATLTECLKNEKEGTKLIESNSKKWTTIQTAQYDDKNQVHLERKRLEKTICDFGEGGCQGLSGVKVHDRVFKILMNSLKSITIDRNGADYDEENFERNIILQTEAIEVITSVFESGLDLKREWGKPPKTPSDPPKIPSVYSTYFTMVKETDSNGKEKVVPKFNFDNIQEHIKTQIKVTDENKKEEIKSIETQRTLIDRGTEDIKQKNIEITKNNQDLKVEQAKKDKLDTERKLEKDGDYDEQLPKVNGNLADLNKNKNKLEDELKNLNKVKNENSDLKRKHEDRRDHYGKEAIAMEKLNKNLDKVRKLPNENHQKNYVKKIEDEKKKELAARPEWYKNKLLWALPAIALLIKTQFNM